MKKWHIYVTALQRLLIQMGFETDSWMNMLKKWNELPEFMKTKEVKAYYDILANKEFSLGIKRVFDVIMATILIVILAIPMLVVAIMIKMDSHGPVFYRQERVTTYGKSFLIYKFRTMVDNAENIGASVTVGDDARITRIGKKLRAYRIDELPQLFNVLSGDMSFVGTRPEVPKYVKHYTKEMYATLLLPAGITSEASIRYKDEAQLLDAADDVEKTYVEKVLPEKMKYNLKSIRKFSFAGDISVMVRTVFAVLRIGKL